MRWCASQSANGGNAGWEQTPARATAVQSEGVTISSHKGPRDHKVRSGGAQSGGGTSSWEECAAQKRYEAEKTIQITSWKTLVGRQVTGEKCRIKLRSVKEKSWMTKDKDNIIHTGNVGNTLRGGMPKMCEKQINSHNVLRRGSLELVYSERKVSIRSL